MRVEAGKTYIRKVRATSSARDTLALQLGLRRVLSSAELHPTGLPASTILCIRTLHDPQPGALQLQQWHHSIRPPQKWEQAIIASLDSLGRQAVRPITGLVPANAPAVIFADRAELLACLARDWCENCIAQRWWWQSLFKDIDIAGSVLAIWLDTPEYIPAALQHLAVMKKVVSFVRELSSNDAQTVLQSIIHSFSLRNLSGFPPVVIPIQNADKTEGKAKISIPPAVTQVNVPAEQSPKLAQCAPWQPWVPESSESSLPLEQQYLLGIGLLLQRMPAVTRTAAFAHAAKRWYREAYLSQVTSASIVEMPHVYTAEPQLEAPKGTINAVPAATERVHATPVAEPTTRTDIDKALTTLIQDAGLANTNVSQTVSANFANSMSDTIVAEMIPTSTSSIHKRQLTSDEQDQDTLFEATIETALGGLFYLVNLGLFLNLYGDFTTPFQPGIALSIWDFVVLVGQHLLGERIQHDPIWELLAQLAGRDVQEVPGKDFDVPQEWRLPVEWLLAFPERGGWEWRAERGRLQVKHCAGFVLLDVPMDDGDAVVEQLRREMQVYGADVEKMDVLPQSSRYKQKSTYAEGIVPQMARWLDWLMPYIRARLIRALDVHAEDLPELVCSHPARVFVTATHVDIFLALAELPIAIRLAGLDRNPGWVPAAGRFVAFHFE